MAAVPLIQTSILRPFTRYLEQLGAPVENGLRKAKLPVISLDNPALYISTAAFWDFAGIMAQREGIENLGILVGEAAGANSLAPTFRQLLLTCPTLYQALLLTSRKLASRSSLSYIGVVDTGADTSRFYHHTSFGLQHPSHYHMEWFALSAMVEIVRVFTGRDWRPAEIGLISRRVPGRMIQSRFPDTRFVYGQPSSYLNIDAALLSTPPCMDSGMETVDESTTPLSTGHSHPADDFAGSLKQLLAAYLPEGTPSVNLIADVAGTSTRTLQRQLRAAGLNYRELLEQVRYDRAIRLLANPDNTIIDIASQLGYSEPTHFTRAFRRMAGISPRAYKRQLTT